MRARFTLAQLAQVFCEMDLDESIDEIGSELEKVIPEKFCAELDAIFEGTPPSEEFSAYWDEHPECQQACSKILNAAADDLLKLVRRLWSLSESP